MQSHPEGRKLPRVFSAADIAALHIMGKAMHDGNIRREQRRPISHDSPNKEMVGAIKQDNPNRR